MTQNQTTLLSVRAKCCMPKIAYWLKRGDRTVGLALAMANGTWGAFSHIDAEKSLSSERFENPQKVAAWAQAKGLGA